MVDTNHHTHTDKQAVSQKKSNITTAANGIQQLYGLNNEHQKKKKNEKRK